MSNRTEALSAYIERVVSSAPPLTNEQRDKLSVLLNPPEPQATLATIPGLEESAALALSERLG